MTKKDYSLVDYPNVGENYGHYSGNYPAQAAKKIFNKLSKKIGLNNSSKKFIVFTIVDNSSKKLYKYHGTRVKLHEPIEFTRGGKNFKLEYRVIVTKYDDTMENKKYEINI